MDFFRAISGKRRLLIYPSHATSLKSHVSRIRSRSRNADFFALTRRGGRVSAAWTVQAARDIAGVPTSKYKCVCVKFGCALFLDMRPFHPRTKGSISVCARPVAGTVNHANTACTYARLPPPPSAYPVPLYTMLYPSPRTPANRVTPLAGEPGTNAPPPRVYYLRRRKKVGRKSLGYGRLRPVIKSLSTWCQQPVFCCSGTCRRPVHRADKGRPRKSEPLTFSRGTGYLCSYTHGSKLRCWKSWFISEYKIEAALFTSSRTKPITIVTALSRVTNSCVFLLQSVQYIRKPSLYLYGKNQQVRLTSSI